MLVLIDNKSGTPIYDQIYTQIKGQIISGALREDEMLPSIRALAKDLRISVITTKRAYDELEQEGFIYTLPGKGSFVAKRNLQLVREENLRRIEQAMQEIRRLAASSGLSRVEVLEMWDLMWEEQT
ncbi:MAG: GntR family transcriptional regulator [Oscillospiraceae bacterium]|nr:GntR family transcriptional regulator [Oscillospiraceae bacterium]